MCSSSGGDEADDDDVAAYFCHVDSPPHSAEESGGNLSSLSHQEHDLAVVDAESSSNEGSSESDRERGSRAHAAVANVQLPISLERGLSGLDHVVALEDERSAGGGESSDADSQSIDSTLTSSQGSDSDDTRGLGGIEDLPML